MFLSAISSLLLKIEGDLRPILLWSRMKPGLLSNAVPVLPLVFGFC